MRKDKCMIEAENSGFEIIEIDGVKVAIDRSIVSQAILSAMSRKQYEHVEARIGRALFDTDEIQPGQRILEIGAGLGYVGSALYGSGKVEKITSYEANPNLIPLIRETHRLNGVKSEVRNFLLGAEKSGSGSIFVPEHFWSASTNTNKNAKEYKVRYASLQESVQELQPSILLVDIEGGEKDIFLSLKEMPSVHSILIELHQMAIGRSGIKNTFEALHSLGFSYDQRYSNGKVVLFQKVDFPMSK